MYKKIYRGRSGGLTACRVIDKKLGPAAEVNGERPNCGRSTADASRD